MFRSQFSKFWEPNFAIRKSFLELTVDPSNCSEPVAFEMLTFSLFLDHYEILLSRHYTTDVIRFIWATNSKQWQLFLVTVKVHVVDQEEEECLFPLPASLTAVPNTLRHHAPAVHSSLTNALVNPVALELAHFSLFTENYLSVSWIISVPSSIGACVITVHCKASVIFFTFSLE